MREDLYEQCSFHIAEKIPSSVKVGTRPISFRMRSYSSGFSPWAATSSGVIWGSFMGPLLGRSAACEKAFYGAFPPCPELCNGWARPGFAQRGRIGFKDWNTHIEGHFDVNDLSKTAFRHRPDLHVETEGEFAGWRTWSRDSFESHIGPFWHRMDENGRVRCAFRVEKKHLNGMRNVHGGCFHDVRRLLPVRASPLPSCRARA